MLSRVDFVLNAQQPLSANMGSLFHGYIMENIDYRHAEHLHSTSLNPYSQFIFFDRQKGRYIWRLNTCNTMAKTMIIDKIVQCSQSEIYLKNKDLKIAVEAIVPSADTAYSDIYLQQQPLERINFVTATNYKSAGQYGVFPRIDVLLMGVINKINAFSSELTFQDKALIEDLLSSVYIKHYQLKSTRFGLEGISINGYTGYIKLAVKRQSKQHELLWLILKAASYTGMGIKTALGMGGIHVK